MGTKSCPCYNYSAAPSPSADVASNISKVADHTVERVTVVMRSIDYGHTAEER